MAFVPLCFRRCSHLVLRGTDLTVSGTRRGWLRGLDGSMNNAARGELAALDDGAVAHGVRSERQVTAVQIEFGLAAGISVEAIDLSAVARLE